MEVGLRLILVDLRVLAVDFRLVLVDLHLHSPWLVESLAALKITWIDATVESHVTTPFAPSENLFRGLACSSLTVDSR